MNSLGLYGFWQKIFPKAWVLGFTLVVVFAVPRFFLVLGANISGDYSKVSFIFLTMMVFPFLFLTKKGRCQIGLRKPEKWIWLPLGIVFGFSFALLMHLTGELFFGLDIRHWFVYIAKSYSVDLNELMVYFLIYSLVGMTFSPIGEEIFYRGLIHGTFIERFGEKRASDLDSMAFALTHLAHFGIVYTAGNWQFLLIPAILWVLFIFFLAKLFTFCKRRSGSVWAAVFAHAGFNLGMMFMIFFKILGKG